MKRHFRHNLIKRVHARMPHGAPFDVAALKGLGVDGPRAVAYAKQGWLVRLGQGVYAFPGDVLTPHGAVKLLQGRVAGLHVGGKSALALHGVRQNLGARETLVLWGDRRLVLPAWFLSIQTARYVSASIFEWPDAKLRERTLVTPPGVTEGLAVSVQERAALEMLYDVGTHEGLEEARQVFEGLHGVRYEFVGRLLERCTSVKAVRLFLAWSRATGLLDVEALRRDFALRVGSELRWMSRMRDGTLLTLKPYG